MIRAEEKRPGRICFLCRPAKGPADPAGGELEAARASGKMLTHCAAFVRYASELLQELMADA